MHFVVVIGFNNSQFLDEADLRQEEQGMDGKEIVFPPLKDRVGWSKFCFGRAPSMKEKVEEEKQIPEEEGEGGEDGELSHREIQQQQVDSELDTKVGPSVPLLSAILKLDSVRFNSVCC